MNAIATLVPRSRPGRRAVRAASLAAGLAAALLVPCPLARAQSGPTLLVLPASGREISAAIIVRARALLVESLGKPGRFSVIDYDRPPTSSPVFPADGARLARLMGADVAVSFDLARDAGETVFELGCTEAVSGRSVCHVREATRAGPELLPDFAEWMALRLGRALQSAQAEARTTRGAEMPRRPRAITFGVRAAVMMAVESPATDKVMLGGLGLVMAADSGSLLADVSVERVTGGDQHIDSVGVGAYLPLGEGGRIPYLGVGAHWVDQRMGGRGATGLQLRPTLGMLWGRSDVVRLRVEAGYFVDLFDEQNLDRLFPGSDAAHRVHGFNLGMGVTF